MAITFDFINTLINVTSPQTDVDCQDLINEIRTAEASAQGIRYPKIANASGKESLGTGVAVGITIELQNGWQLQFWDGAYTATIAGGNLVGGPGGDPIAYTAGVQVVLIQSAASTIVEFDEARLDAIELNAAEASKILGNRLLIDESSNTMIIYDDDGVTPLKVFNLRDINGNPAHSGVYERIPSSSSSSSSASSA